MRRLSILIAIVILVLGVGGLLFFLKHELPNPPGWPQDVKQYRKSAFGGLTRVVDTKSGDLLFIYLPEYDQHVHPVKIEKIDDRHWQVVLEKP